MPLANTSFPVTPEQELAQPLVWVCRGATWGGLQVSRVSVPLSVSALSPPGPEVPPPYVLSCPSPASPPCCSQCHGGTGPCPGTSAAAGLSGTCTPLDGLKVEHTETFLAAPVSCLELCVCMLVCCARVSPQSLPPLLLSLP